MGLFSKKKTRVERQLIQKKVDFHVDTLNNYVQDGNKFYAQKNAKGKYCKGRKITVKDWYKYGSKFQILTCMPSQMFRFRAEGYRNDVRVWYTEMNVSNRDIDSHNQPSQKFIEEVTFFDGTFVTLKVEINPYETIVEYFINENILVGKTIFKKEKD
jgi:hypothetical protein